MSEKVEKDITVSEEDRLRAVNIHLQVLNCLQEHQLILSEFEKLGIRQKGNQEKLQRLNINALEHLEYLQKEYGIDLTTHEIDHETGAVTLKQGNNLLEQLQQKIQGTKL